MDTTLKAGLWQQFGAAIDTLDSAISLCPDALWTAALWQDPDDARYGQFWYVAYHTLSWTDLFLGGVYADFKPPAPFVRGVLPETPYTKTDISAYLQSCRQKCKATLNALTDERANQVCVFDWMQPTYLELQFYSMRHVQEHASQFNLFLGQHGYEVTDWIAQASDRL